MKESTTDSGIYVELWKWGGGESIRSDLIEDLIVREYSRNFLESLLDKCLSFSCRSDGSTINISDIVNHVFSAGVDFKLVEIFREILSLLHSEPIGSSCIEYFHDICGEIWVLFELLLKSDLAELVPRYIEKLI